MCLSATTRNMPVSSALVDIGEPGLCFCRTQGVCMCEHVLLKRTHVGGPDDGNVKLLLRFQSLRRGVSLQLLQGVLGLRQ